jgi:hypothetical protein
LERLLVVFSSLFVYSLAMNVVDFPFVHPTIARVLALQQGEEGHTDRFFRINVKQLTIEETATSQKVTAAVHVDELIPLAFDCEAALSPLLEKEREQLLSPWACALLDLPSTTVATLFALYRLESVICSRAGYTRGKAPLLKTMLCKLRDPQSQQQCCPSLALLLECLLLPTGLNLRNLLWHGFVGTVSRPWLALVVILVNQLEMGSSLHLEKVDSVDPPPLDGDLQEIAWRGQEMLPSDYQQSIPSWLVSPSHVTGLWETAMKWIEEERYPACTCVVLTVLLEHGEIYVA